MDSGGPGTGWVPVAQASRHLLASLSRWALRPLYDDSCRVRLTWASLGRSSAPERGRVVAAEAPAPSRPTCFWWPSRQRSSPLPRRRPGVGVGGDSTLAHPAGPEGAVPLHSRGPRALGRWGLERGLWWAPLSRQRAWARSPQLHIPVFSS